MGLDHAIPPRGLRPRGFPARPRGLLDYWLAEPYCLYAVDCEERLYLTKVHHAPWALQPVEAKILWNTVSTAAGIELPPQPPLAAFARRLDVVVRTRVGSYAAALSPVEGPPAG